MIRGDVTVFVFVHAKNFAGHTCEQSRSHLLVQIRIENDSCGTVVLFDFIVKEYIDFFGVQDQLPTRLY